MLVHTLNIQRSYEIPSAGSSALEQLYPDLIKDRKQIQSGTEDKNQLKKKVQIENQTVK